MIVVLIHHLVSAQVPKGLAACPYPIQAAPVRSDPLRERITRHSPGIPPIRRHVAPASTVMYVPHLHYFDTSNSISFTSHGHFNRVQSSAGVYTSFDTSAETLGLLEGGAWIFFWLHASGNVKSKICMAATFQLVKRGSLPSLHFRIFSSASRAAPVRGAMRGNVTPHAPCRWISVALVRQRSGPGKPHLLILFDVGICFRPK